MKRLLNAQENRPNRHMNSHKVCNEKRQQL